MNIQIIFTLSVLLLGISNVLSSKILFVVAFPGKSHWLMFEHVIKELLNRGHEVTALTGYQLKTESPNYTQVLIDPLWDFESKLNMSEFYKNPLDDIFTKISTLWEFGTITTTHALETENVKHFIKNNNDHFDLVISEHFMQDPALMFAFKYNAPIVEIATLDYDDIMDQSMGALSAWSHIPHFMSDMDHNMNFYQRCKNTIFSLYDVFGRRFTHSPKMDAIARKTFSELEKERGPLPSVYDLQKSISVILVNSHPVLNHPRPKMPGLIDISGIHIRKPSPLPDELQQFLDSATEGAIYMSFGTFMQPSFMPENVFEAFMETIKSIKYKVLWKFDADLKGLPPNVMVRKWLPQNDILAHKNVKLFVNHGGVFGMLEALYHKTPMLIFPFYGDQHKNAKKVVDLNIGMQMNLIEVTSEVLVQNIKKIIQGNKCYKNIEYFSNIYRDNQVEPMESAMYWIEYVIRYKGAKHLKSSAVKLSWYQYLLLDVFGAALTLVFLIIFVIKKCLNFACSQKSSKEISKGKKFK